MRFFLDTGNIDEIKQVNDLGLLDGITTNPSIMHKETDSEAGKFKIYEEILKICPDRPVSFEVLATDCEGMIKEAEELQKFGQNVVIKLPITIEGIKACNILTSRGFMTNMTLCFSSMQALMVAKVNATFVSPFIGRLDDISTDGMELIAQIRAIYDNYGFNTQILAASIRHPMHVRRAAEIGADVATMPFKTIMQLVKHPLTDSGLSTFLSHEWKK